MIVPQYAVPSILRLLRGFGSARYREPRGTNNLGVFPLCFLNCDLDFLPPVQPHTNAYPIVCVSGLQGTVPKDLNNISLPHLRIIPV
jgi:hypothetical protein